MWTSLVDAVLGAEEASRGKILTVILLATAPGPKVK
jgi:hypothetical protein